ncbi:hypothetical protein EMCG_08020 [[Emmonsia] crescens]|uniref:Uncharacterized protein n=1 Tax=[Emmonsia] crescens TaxID=73230 RepID=A0A0G2J4X9_9EURO|nr:hypothetical protein EMCG_08020 [Emmonsia crescens UAMH 3008]
MSLSIYGSPWTPQYSVPAFQHLREEDAWNDLHPAEYRHVVVHGPLRFHLNRRDFHHAGCPLLGAEIARVKSRLVVFGYSHVTYGREEFVLDWTRRIYKEVMNSWAGWFSLVWMTGYVLFARLKLVFTSLAMTFLREQLYL